MKTEKEIKNKLTKLKKSNNKRLCPLYTELGMIEILEWVLNKEARSLGVAE